MLIAAAAARVLLLAAVAALGVRGGSGGADANAGGGGGGGGVAAYDYYRLLDADALYAHAQATRVRARPVTRTGCSLFVDQRAARGSAALGGDGRYDAIVDVPLAELALARDAAYNVHVSVHARFLERNGGGGGGGSGNATTAGGAALVPSDLVVGLRRGAQLVGFARTTPAFGGDADADAEDVWGAPVAARYAARAAAAGAALDADTLEHGRATRVARCSPRCSRAGAESFDVLFNVGATTSVVARARAEHAAVNAPGGAEFDVDLRADAADADASSSPLRLVLHAGDWDHAYEVSAVEVRVHKVLRARSLADNARADGSLDAYVARTSTVLYSNMWPAVRLAAADADADADADAAPVFAADRAHRVARDGCGVAFDAAAPTDADADADADAAAAFGSLLALPLALPAHHAALDPARHYVVHVAVEVDADSSRNNLVVGVADGLHAGAHVVGFERADRHAAGALGWGFGGTLDAQRRVARDAFAEVAVPTAAAASAGAAGATGAAAPPRAFTVDIVVGGGATRVFAAPLGAGAAGRRADVYVDTERFGLDVARAAPLYLVLLQGASALEASTVRFVAASVDEVRIGCDGVPNSGKLVDRCGVCGGDDACVGCDGVPHSGVRADRCGVCAGDGRSCLDCHGVVHGTSRVDACGVCDGADACLDGGAGDKRKQHVAAAAAAAALGVDGDAAGAGAAVAGRSSLQAAERLKRDVAERFAHLDGGAAAGAQQRRAAVDAFQAEHATLAAKRAAREASLSAGASDGASDGASSSSSSSSSSSAAGAAAAAADAAALRRRSAASAEQRAAAAAAAAPAAQHAGARTAAASGRSPQLHHERRSTGGVADAVDCDGVPRRDGGRKEFDRCGVCGGDDACVGCDGVPNGQQYDACGVCGGTNSTCCHNYADVPNAYWDFLLLPVTLDGLIAKLESAYAAVAKLNQCLPQLLGADDADAAELAAALHAGRMAEFNRIFIDECIGQFCTASGEFYTALVADNAKTAATIAANNPSA